MPTSIFLAKLIGPILLAIGLGLLANGAAYRKLTNEFLHSRALICLSGLISMAAGLAVVLTHNVWTADWRVLITLLGWLALIGGALRLIVPQELQTIGKWFTARSAAFTTAGAVWLAVGAVLSFFGYAR